MTPAPDSRNWHKTVPRRRVAARIPCKTALPSIGDRKWGVMDLSMVLRLQEGLGTDRVHEFLSRPNRWGSQ
jgi:hypothetical protein